MIKATIVQLEFIEVIEEFVSERFTGQTKEDAQHYISRNINEFKLNSASNWALINGY